MGCGLIRMNTVSCYEDKKWEYIVVLCCITEAIIAWDFADMSLC